jgi:hypothetical protein
MQERSMPRWLLPVLVFILLAAIVAILFADRLGRSAPVEQLSIPLADIQPVVVNPDRTSATRPKDPCSLLMPAELEAVLGIPVGDPYSEAVDNPLGELVCIVPGVNEDERAYVRLVTVYTAAMEPFLIENDYSVDHLFAGRDVSGGLTRPIQSVGDAAFWGGSGPELWNGLHVLIWDVYMQLNVNTGDEAFDLEAAQILAISALNHLFNE